MRNSQLGFLAERQLGHALIPALDDTANTDLGGEGVFAVVAAVELAAVCERALVVDRDGVAFLGVVGSVAGGDALDFDAHGWFGGVEVAVGGEGGEFGGDGGTCGRG